jgi:hypothetical protein
MALHLFNHLAPRFPHNAYKALKLDEGSSNAAEHLAAVLTSLGMPHANSNTSAPMLLQQLRDCVKQRQVLLVLDNVSHYQQLDDMLPTEFAAGSVVIITSRQSSMPEYNGWQQVLPSST